MKYENLIRKLLAETVRDITSLGSLAFAFLSIAIMFLIDSRIAISLFFALAAVEASSSLVKLLFYKKRPDGQKYSNLFEKIDSGSFPSVHCARFSLIALTYYTLNSSLFSSVLALFFIFLVALSRIQLKKHYFTDVAAGIIIGLIVWFLFFRLLFIPY